MGIELDLRDEPPRRRRVRTPEGRERYGLPIGASIPTQDELDDLLDYTPPRQKKIRADEFYDDPEIDRILAGGWQAPPEVSYDRIELQPYQSVSAGGYTYTRTIKDPRGQVTHEEYVLDDNLRHLANSLTYGGSIVRPNEFVKVQVAEPLAPSIVPPSLRDQFSDWFARQWGVERLTSRQRRTEALMRDARKRVGVKRPENLRIVLVLTGAVLGLALLSIGLITLASFTG